MRGVIGLAMIFAGLGWAYAIAIGKWPPQGASTASGGSSSVMQEAKP